MEWSRFEAESTGLTEGFERELTRIQNQVDTDPWGAYYDLMTAIALFNGALQLRWTKLPDVTNRLKNWIKYVQSTVQKLAIGLKRTTNVSGYSVGIGFPLGISVSISFSV